MTRRNDLAAWLLAGAVAGQVGGVVYGLVMRHLGVIESIAALVRLPPSAVGGWIVHMIVAGVIGAGFAALIRRQEHSAGDLLFWGLIYGAAWWIIGPLTLAPLLIRREALAWDLTSAQETFPMLLGHLQYGVTTSLALLVWRRSAFERPTVGCAVRGVLAGVVAAALTGKALVDQGLLGHFVGIGDHAPSASLWLGVLATGAMSGLAFAAVVPTVRDSAGAALVRGFVFGFLAWILVPMTIVGLATRGMLPWGMGFAHDAFPGLLAYLLFGGILGLAYQWLSVAWRVLFAETTADEDEGYGTEGLRALGRGSAAGIAGGLLYTVMLARLGSFEGIAQLMRADNAAVGVLVHAVVSVIWGAVYGLLFRRQTYGIGSAVGWGVAFGFFIWVVGPNTLFAVLTGQTPDWSADSTAPRTASLVGHLVYGAVLGVGFHYFESRHNPWWQPRRERLEARADQRRRQLQTSAPAIWALVMLVALMLPIIFGGSDEMGRNAMRAESTSNEERGPPMDDMQPMR